MGESFSKAVEPEELVAYKTLSENTDLDCIEIPEKEENRRPTDKKFFIAFLVLIVLLLPFLTYSFIKSDLARLGGYDQCGNVCGKQNAKYDEWPCTGKDFTNQKFLKLSERVTERRHEEFISRECVSSCPKGQAIFGRCTYTEDSDYNGEGSQIFTKWSDYLRHHSWQIVLSCFISLGVTLGMVFLFRTATAAVVWGILGGVNFFGIIVVIYLWYLYVNLEGAGQDKVQGIQHLCIFFTIFFTVLLCITAFMYKRIRLVIMLFKETTKAMIAMPLLVFVPILTFVGILIIGTLLIFTSLVISTAGSLTELYENFYYYEKDPIILFTMFYNGAIAIWCAQFITGLQYMVIAGAVSTWYWSTNKSNLGSPIFTSARVAFKFHLGSVAFGSLIVTLVAIIRGIISSLTKNSRFKICVDYFMRSIERFIKYLSKSSYIMTAMHGEPFFKSGKRAAKIILQNALNIAAINYVGDFVLGMAAILVALITLLITCALMQGTDQSYAYLVYTIVGIAALVIASIFFSLFQTVVDTIFLCFCEDSMLNDGMARPFAMSRDLMEFVENSKKVCPAKK